MTKDGFVFLVMGFTGKDAARFKEAYITRFNEMEEQLRGSSRFTPLGRIRVHNLDYRGNHVRALSTDLGVYLAGVYGMQCRFPSPQL